MEFGAKSQIEREVVEVVIDREAVDVADGFAWVRVWSLRLCEIERVEADAFRLQLKGRVEAERDIFPPSL